MTDQTDPPTEQPPLEVPVSTVAPPSSSGVSRIPVLPFAIAIVAILAGGALFLSGYSMGRQ